MTFTQYLRLIDVQARMQLKADSAKFTLGFLWWFLEPLLWVSVFFIVFNLILDSGRRSGDFILFLACGKFAFIWFSRTVLQSSTSIVRAEGLVGKINVPKSLFPLASVQEGLYRQVTIYALLLVILALAGVGPTRYWLWLLPIALVMHLMIIGCALLASYLVCLLRDFQKAVPLAMTFLLFTSGIFWDVHRLGDPEKAQLLLTINPLAFILDAHRQALMYAHSPDPLHLFLVGVGALVMVLLMLLLMRRHSQFIALKVLA